MLKTCRQCPLVTWEQETEGDRISPRNHQSQFSGHKSIVEGRWFLLHRDPPVGKCAPESRREAAISPGPAECGCPCGMGLTHSHHSCPWLPSPKTSALWGQVLGTSLQYSQERLLFSLSGFLIALGLFIAGWKSNYLGSIGLAFNALFHKPNICTGYNLIGVFQISGTTSLGWWGSRQATQPILSLYINPPRLFWNFSVPWADIEAGLKDRGAQNINTSMCTYMHVLMGSSFPSGPLFQPGTLLVFSVPLCPALSIFSLLISSLSFFFFLNLLYFLQILKW